MGTDHDQDPRRPQPNPNPNLNPFLNHLVIQNIVRHVSSISDLENLRETCRLWHQLMTPVLMEKSVVNINSGKRMKRYMDTFDNKNEKGTSTPPPHLNFHLKVLSSLEAEETKDFLNFILQSAEELHVSKCVIKPSEMDMVLRMGKKLRTLSFNEVVVDEEEDEEEDTTGDNNWETLSLRRLEVTACDEGESFPWEEIFRRTKGLQALHAQLQSPDQVTNLLESLACLKDPLINLLEFSSFLVDLNSSQLQLLTSLNFPLKVVDLSIGESVKDFEIEAFLRHPSHKGLQNVKLFHETEEGVMTLRIPCLLDHLTSLELMGDAVDSRIFQEIGKCCRNLKHLNLSQIDDTEGLLRTKKKTNKEDEKLIKHGKLSSLSIEEGFLPPDSLGKLSLMFPNIRTVCLFLNDENIPALFQHFRNLEEIMILGTELGDIGIMGGGGKKGIAECRKLRKFRLYPQPQPRIADLSIYHGLMHVKELTWVELPETGVTNEGLRALMKAKPNLVHLSAKIAIDLRTGHHCLRSPKYQIV